MPIDIDEFEQADKDFTRGGSRTEFDPVLKYLAFNPRKAYSRKEIQASVGLSWIEVIATLSRLEAKGLVRHKGEYWTVEEDYELPKPLAEER